ncbi:SRPBCC family protein [Marinivivus vitaminiproducens]|uniref:SRPBCC family protein n=1 Tax=Marinivivus vitaminiproducens TaxID=3035935 RepID=UPI00279E27D1|nr:SRPBCC domain-containing protein [Geminicoccaceae bacterium SCSIO 64248]
MREPEHSVTIVHAVDASAEDLYAAWTEPERMRRWLALEVEADVREGGDYRIVDRQPDGSTRVYGGTYREIEPGRRMAATFNRPDALGSGRRDEFVEVVFKALGPARASLSLTNGWDGQGMTDAEFDALEQRWAVWLERLEALFPRHGGPH